MAQATYNQVFEIEEPETGKIYRVEGVEGTTREEAIEYLSTLPEEEIAKRQVLKPNAMLGANTQQGTATRTLEDFPEGKQFLQDQFYNRKQFGEVQGEFNKRYGALGIKLPENMAGAWAENQALFDTPAGRQYLQNNDPIAPVQKATGVEDPLAPDSVLEQAGQSAVKSVYDMANTVRGAGAVVADLVGADETAQRWADDYLEQQAAIGIEFPTASGNAVDIRSFDDFGMWAADTLGSLGPQIAAFLGGGAVGGLVARKLVERKAAEFIEKRVAEGAVRELAEKEVARQIEKATLKGGIAGAGAVSEVQSVGGVYGDTYGATGELAPWTSLLAGTAVAALDTIIPARILSKVGGPVANDIIADGLVKRLGKEGAAQFLLEGGTEALQTVIEQLPAGQPINWDQVLEAGLRGGFGGSVTGAATAGYQAVTQTPSKLPAQPRTAVPEGVEPISVPEAAPKRSAGYRAAIEKTRQGVENRARNLTSSWENAPEIEVHTNFQKLKGVSNSAIGVYSDGKLQLNTENIVKEARRRNVTPDDIVSAVTYHEGLGHHGLLQLFGEELDGKLATILDQSTVYRARVDKWLKKNPDAYEGDPNRDLRAFEELLAEGSEGGQLPASFVNVLKNTVKDFGRRMGLDLEYSTREVQTILGLAHSAVVSGKGRDARSNGFRFMYAGENAETAHLGRLEFAKSLTRAGVDSEKIRKGVGWFKGPDNKWRFEIDDSKMKSHVLDSDDAEWMEDNSGDDFNSIDARSWEYMDGITALARPNFPRKDLPLDKVINHPELFEAYPELRELRVTRAEEEFEGPNDKGFFENGVIGLNPSLNDREALNTLLHEIQHGVQMLEGFARGGNSDSAIDQAPEDIIMKGARQFYKWLGKQDASLSQEEQAAKTKVRSIVKETIEAKDVRGIRDLLKVDHSFMRGARYEAYQHLFGEVEARDTQNRQDYTAEERQEWEPYGQEPWIDPDSYIYDMNQGTKHRYMMMTNPDKVEFTPEEIAAMTPEELFESENTMKILNQMTEGYEPVIMSFDDLEEEARLRDLRPSTVMRKKGIGAGEIVKRLYMYDIAMTKINDKLSGLLEKIQSGNYTADDKINFISTTVKQQELAARIFEDQGEVGRALAAMKTLQYTRRSTVGMQETLQQFGDNSPFAHLNDEEAFLKFAMGISDQIAAGKEKMKEKGKDWAVNALNLPRALMSTLDLSAPLRQGLFLIHKGAWWKSFFNMFRYWSSEQAFKDLREDIMARPTYGEMLRAKLALSDIDGKLTSREEDFQTEWAQKIPGLGRLVRMSERAYSGFLNKLRADVFDQLVAKLPEGYTDKDLQDLGRFINAASGRGNLPKGLQSSAPLLNALLFSPRLIASRVVMTTALVDPRTYTTMNKVARNEYVKSILTVGATATLILSLAAMAGAEVEKDPRSSDFAKIKVGNTRYDILGGESQYITLASRLYMNSTKTADGAIRPYGNDFGQTTRKDAAYKFFENKAAPVPSFVLDYLRGTNAIGEKFEMDSALVQRFVPMFAMDMYENVRDEGFAKGSAMSAPAVFGVGVQNYKSYSQDAERELEAPETFAMKTAKDGEYNNATVEDGIVKLDEKAQLEWNRILNTYIREWMKDEMAKPEWKTMTKEERAAAIKAVRDDARKETKFDMLELLQIEEEAE